MASETKKLKLNDGMTPVLKSIAASINLTVNTLSTAQSALYSAFNTASISAAGAEINNVLTSLSQYQDELGGFTNSPNPPGFEWTPMRTLDDMPAYFRTDESNNQLETMPVNLSQMTDIQGGLSLAMPEADVSAANEAYEQLNSVIRSVNQNLTDSLTVVSEKWKPVQAPAVFLNSGAQRFQLEFEAASQAASQLVLRQQAISAAARQMQIMPQGMLNDVSVIEDGILALAGRIQQLDGIPINMRTDQVNNQLEGLRSQLSQITGIQSQLNTAISQMDVNEANRLYQQLNDAVNEANRGIRDNLSAQEQFNESITACIDGAKWLGSTIKSFAGMVFNKENVIKVMDLSDETAQMTTRLNLVNDGSQSEKELQEKVYDSAQRSGSSYLDTANTVANIGNSAGQAFGSTEEIIVFTEQLNKQLAISGTPGEEAGDVTSQITEALANGILSGDEFNSILGKAPTIAQSIADYMQIPMDEMENMASQGAVSASVIKNALFATAQETNQKFQEMPMTFNKIGERINNGALIAFQPVLEKINEIANSPEIQALVNNMVSGLQEAASCALYVFDLIGQGISWAYENWGFIQVLIWAIAGAMAAWAVTTVATAVAANGLNFALLQNPLTWLFVLIGIIVAAIVSWINSMGGLQIAWLVCVNEILTRAENLRVGWAYVWMVMQNKLDEFRYGIEVFKTNVLNTLGNLKVSGLTILEGFINGAIDQINKLIEMTNTVLGISIKPIEHVEFAANAAINEEIKQKIRAENLAAMQEENNKNRQVRAWNYLQLQGQIDEQSAARRAVIERMRQEAASKEEKSKAPNWERESYDASAYIQEQGTMPLESIAGSTGETARNTAALSNDMDILSEDLKYMRDAAEQEIINRFTLAELKIDVNNNNTLTTKTDLDDLGRVMTEATAEMLSIAAEGV